MRSEKRAGTGAVRSRRFLGGVFVTVVVTALATACGQEAPPGEDVPALARSLEKVDRAIEAGDTADARRAVEDLIARTGQARVEGDISDDEADRIFEAAQDVLAQLPAGHDDGPADDPTDGASSDPPEEVFPDEGSVDEGGSGDEGSGDGGEGKVKGNDKGKERDKDKDHGHGG